ncbi:ATP-binding cassette, subfamily B [Treponema bryantii]|uniref:ATP-binding cassette, subfamily B n=1 Tax=Treponema bryantii TaxID=163 RepID=A0A1I3M9E4_9SPIR|nr:ABC transporter ATP-binding protein [Treponema bryantii]SFI93593.1 ATP-binding cassette, subfamily B [Treponema bryantii]
MKEKTAFSWVWSYVRKYRFGMAAGLFLSVIVAAMNMVNPLVTGSIVDKVIKGGQHELLFKLIAIMLGVVVGKSIFRYSYQVIFEHCSQNVILKMREDLYAHIQKLDFSWYDNAPSGNVMTLLTSDLDKVRHFVAWVLYQILENSLIYIFSIITLASINWKLTLAFLVIAPPVLLLVKKFKVHIRPAHMRVRDQFAVLNTRVGENIEGNRVVKAFVRENYETERFEKENEGYRDVSVANADMRVKFMPWIDALCQVLPVILILFGGYLVINNEMTIGQLVTFNGLMWAFIQPINMFGNLVDNTQNFGASADRLFELYKAEPKIKNTTEAENSAEGTVEKTSIEGRVEFRNVCFAYNETPVIKDMSFVIEPGTTVGILGPTGSGKSTIANLMCRYYDADSGQILIDGKDVREYNLQELRRNVGITMQEAFLFSDTVEGNIAFAKTDASFEDVENAAELARVKEFIGDLTDGYDTIVGERGVGLSGGQKQRIALARLFLADPKIMILDDTTSAVDNDTEYKIRQSIKSRSEGHTAFIISHRVSSFENCDVILVIQDGQIIDKGSHQELISRDGYYHDVWAEQAGK